jgi:hypothetical protein
MFLEYMAGLQMMVPCCAGKKSDLAWAAQANG